MVKMKQVGIFFYLVVLTSPVVLGGSVPENPPGSSSQFSINGSQPMMPPLMNRHIRGINPREMHPIGIYANIGGPGIIGGSVDYFIKPYIELEAGGGMKAVFAGAHYHFTGIRDIPWTPYAGVLVTYIYSGSIPGIYIPGGFQMVQVSGFGLRFEAALWIHQVETSTADSPLTDLEFYGSFRFAIGYHF